MDILKIIHLLESSISIIEEGILANPYAITTKLGVSSFKIKKPRRPIKKPLKIKLIKKRNKILPIPNSS